MKARQSLICGSSIVLCLLFATNVQASNAQLSTVYQVGEVIKGKEYNDVLKRWVERDFSIWVRINNSGDKYILFMADAGLGNAIVRLDYSTALRNEFSSLIEKAIEWSDVARKNKADTTKALGCLHSRRVFGCKETGVPTGKNQMGLTFFATQGGQQTRLVITIVDRDNLSLIANLYLDRFEMEKLLMNMHQIGNAFEKATESMENQELFK